MGTETTTRVPAAILTPLPRYWAFISYSHQDRQWGDWLHRSIETYRVPKALAVSGAPARVFPVFRDREELVGALNLTAKIEQALQESRNLIVVCSPRSAASRWVNEEIRRFAQLGRSDRIFALIVDGEPHSIREDQECFPASLRYQLLPDGSLSDQPSDYLAADARVAGDGKKNALLKLIAGIIDVDYDKLKRRDHERQMRTRTIWIGALFALTLLLAGIAGYALIQRATALRAAIAERAAREGEQQQRDIADQRRQVAEQQTAIATEQKRVAEQQTAIATEQKHVAQRQTVIATEQKRVAVSRQLAAQALSQMTGRIDLALLLAVEASRPAKTVDANNSLLKILQSAPGLVTLLHGHSGRVSQVAFSPDGSVLASGGADSTVRLWNARTGEALTSGPAYRHKAQSDGDNQVTTLAFNQDASIVASGSLDGTLLWGDLRQRTVGVESTFGETVSGIAFTSDGLALASSTGLYLIDLRADKLIGPEFTVDTHDHISPSAAAISPDGKLVAASKMTYPDEGLYLFDASTHQSIGKRMTEQFPLIQILRFSADSKLLAAGSTDGSVRIWDVAERRLVGPALTCDGSVLAMEFRGGGKVLAWACAGGSVRIWDVEKWRAAREPVFVGAAESAAFSPDGSTIALGSADGAVRIWDLGESHHPFGRSIATSQALEAAAISPDGGYAVIGGNSLGMWDLASGEKMRALKGYTPFSAFNLKTSKPFSMAFSKDGRKFVSAGEYGVGLYEMPSGALFPLPSTEEEPYAWSVAITPDGRTLAFGGKGLTLWDVARKIPLPSPMPGKESVYAVAISPDGSTLAAGGEDKSVHMWNLAAGKSMGDAFPFGQEIWSLAFSPDGRILAAGGNEGKLQLWDMKTRLPLGGPIPGHTSRIRSIAFSPDRLFMVAAGFRRKAVIYDVATHQPLGDPLFPDSEYEVIASAAFSPDGQTLLLVDRRQQFFLLAGGPAAWAARACKIANRNLTADEWTRYIGDQPYAKTCPDPPGAPGS